LPVLGFVEWLCEVLIWSFYIGLLNAEYV
jgi:hypothetical protein